jgi:hypothetical protein
MNRKYEEQNMKKRHRRRNKKWGLNGWFRYRLI